MDNESSRCKFSVRLPVSFEISPEAQYPAVVPSSGWSPVDSSLQPLNLNFIILLGMISGNQTQLSMADKDIKLGFYVKKVSGHRCRGCVGCYYYF